MNRYICIYIKLSKAELLLMLPSSYSLNLISIFFGDEVSGSLQEITFSDKDIKCLVTYPAQGMHSPQGVLQMEEISV